MEEQTSTSIEKALDMLIQSNDQLPKEALTFLLDNVFSGDISDVHLSSFLSLVSLKSRLLNYHNLLTIVTHVRKHYVKSQQLEKHFPNTSTLDQFVDVVGTGGDGLNTFNVSTASSFVACGAGCMIAKHGNYSATNTTGSSALFMECLNCDIKNLRLNNFDKIAGNQYIYLLASSYLPNLKHVGDIRKKLKFKSIFNVLGPLLNPLQVKRFVFGVYCYELGELYSKILTCGQYDIVKKGFIVYGEIGIDEVSIEGNTHVWEITNNEIKKYILTPHNFNISSSYKIEDVVTKSSEQNAKIFTDIINGKVKSGPIVDFIVMNSALPIIAAGITDNLKEATELAKESLSLGKTKKVVEKLSISLKNLV